MKFNFELNEVQAKQRQALIHQLKQNKYVLAFLSEFHLSEEVVEQRAQMFADYAEAISKCDQCLGLYACKQENRGFVLGIQVDPLFNRELQACHFKKSQESKRSHRKQFSVLELEDPFLEVRMEDLLKEGGNESYRASLKPVIDWFKTPQTKGFLFYGAPGVGKTHLAMAMMNHFALKNQKVACIHVPSLASKFPSSYYEGSEKESYMHLIKKAQVVLFDDLGAETYSSYFRDEVLFPLLNQRMETKALTIFTSNHSIDALTQHYRFNQKADDEMMKSMRLMERIKALSIPHYIQGTNRRG